MKSATQFRLTSLFTALVFYMGAASCTTTAGSGAQPQLNAAQLERQIHRLINLERQSHGLAALNRDEKLAAIARNHSRDMATQNFFSHINLRGETPVERAKRQGWEAKKPTGPNTWAVGPAENIFLNPLYDNVVTTTQDGVIVKKQYAWKTQDEIAQSTVREWMKSPQHRQNILSPRHDRQGIGVAVSGNSVYITEDLF